MHNRIETWIYSKKEQQLQGQSPVNKLFAFLANTNNETWQNFSFRELLDYLIQYYLDINKVKDDKGNTLLHLAALNPQFPEHVLIEFIDHTELHSYSNDRGFTPFHSACSRNPGLELVKAFIRKGCPKNLPAKNGSLPLHITCEGKGSREVIAYLLDGHENTVNEKNSLGRTPLHYACALHNNLDVIRYLVEDMKCNPGERDLKGNLALHYACQYNDNLDITQYLIKVAKCNPHEKNSEENTILHLACLASKSLELIKYLIEEVQFNTKQKNKKNRTALQLASSQTNLDIVKYLIEEAGCELDLEDGRENPALYAACDSSSNLDMIKYLYERAEAKPTGKQHLAGRALFTAASNSLDIIKYLVGKMDGEHLKRTYDGFLLQAIINNKNLDVIRYLVEELQCDVRQKGAHDNTLLHFACAKNESLDIIKYLIEEVKLDVNQKNEMGSNVLLAACHKKNLNIIKYLIEERKCNPKEVCDKAFNALDHVLNPPINNDLVKYLLCLGVSATLTKEETLRLNEWKKVELNTFPQIYKYSSAMKQKETMTFLTALSIFSKERNFKAPKPIQQLIGRMASDLPQADF